MSEIKIDSLYKTFGNKSKEAVSLAKESKTKTEILKKTGTILALNNISLDIPKGKVFVIIGLSGSGKSTLVRHINRMIDVECGSLLVQNKNVMELNLKELNIFRQTKISMVFQHFGLLPHWTVRDNVAYGLFVRKIPKKDAYQEADKWIDRVDLTYYKTKYPKELSGGMLQRVGLARAFAVNSEIILMDEPFSALDPLIRRSMQKMLVSWQEKYNKTIVFITHDMIEAFRLATNIAILKSGQLVQVGTTEEIRNNPASDYVKKLIESAIF